MVENYDLTKTEEELSQLRVLSYKLKDFKTQNQQLEPQIEKLVKAYDEVLQPGRKFVNPETGALFPYKGYQVWCESFDLDKEYDSTYNWLLIASAGDPTKWQGVEIDAVDVRAK